MAGYKSKSKKGSIFDIIGILVFVFMFILFILLGGKLLQGFNSGIQNSTFSNESKAQIQENTDRFPPVWDGIFGFIFFGVFIVSLISAYFIDTHPVFFVAVFVLLIVVGVISAFIGNGLETIASDPELGVSSYPIIDFVSSHLVIIMLVMLLSIGVVGFAKARST